MVNGNPSFTSAHSTNVAKCPRGASMPWTTEAGVIKNAKRAIWVVGEA